jgi:5-methylcytosine-specific restriction endonuclease McrA
MAADPDWDVDDHVCGPEPSCDVLCGCERARFCSERYRSCYECFLDRRSEYASCIFCGRWHSPDFDTCFNCRPQGRDEAARDLKLVILTRDGHKCRYCGVHAGANQVDPRKVRDNDEGIRPAVLHIDHILPCKKGGTAAPWNLQVLCGVCNIAKSDEWWTGSRHDQARQEVIDAYATYLWVFLTEAEQSELLALVARSAAWQRVLASYRAAVFRARPRPAPRPGAPEVEDVPPEWVYLDLPSHDVSQVPG